MHRLCSLLAIILVWAECHTTGNEHPRPLGSPQTRRLLLHAAAASPPSPPASLRQSLTRHGVLVYIIGPCYTTFLNVLNVPNVRPSFNCRAWPPVNSIYPVSSVL